MTPQRSSTEVTQRVLAMYTRYPFPDRCIPAFHYTQHLAPHLPRHPDTRILDAGCGTGEHSIGAAKLYPWAHVYGLDLSSESVRRAQRLACSEGVANVSFCVGNLMRPLPLAGPFHAIQTLGVLHHLAEPLLGLRNLVPLLADRGVMLVYLYGELGRWDLGLKQRMVNLLEPESLQFEDRLRIARALGLYRPAARTPLDRVRAYVEWLRHQSWRDRLRDVSRRLGGRHLTTTPRNEVGDAVLMDQVAHVNEVRYRVREVLQLVGEAGLELIGFVDEMAQPVEQLIHSEMVLERSRRLSDADCYELKELLLRPGSFTFLARRH